MLFFFSRKHMQSSYSITDNTCMKAISWAFAASTIMLCIANLANAEEDLFYNNLIVRDICLYAFWFICFE